MDIPLDEVLHFDAVTHHPSTGTVVDADSTPTFAVYEEATDTDIGVGGNLTKRTSLTGNYRGTFTASAANGFEVGKWYSIIASATVGAIAGKAVVKNFRIVLAETVAGEPKVDVGAWLGTAVSTPTVAGVPNVNAKTWNDLTTVALPLIPTVAGRTLDVSAGGEAGVDWANVGSPTTTVGLTNTTVGVVTLTNTLTTYTGNTVQTGDSFARIGATGSGLTTLATQASVNTIDDFLDTEIADIQARLPAALSSGNMKCDLLAISTDTAAADALETMLDGTGGSTLSLKNIVISTTTGIAVSVITTAAATDAVVFKATNGQGLRLWNLTGAVAFTLQDSVGDLNIDDSVETLLGMSSTVNEILADTAVIGATGGGLTSLATQTSVNTIDDFLDTEIAALTTNLATLTTYVDTEVAAIKAKTDLIPASPAAVGSAMTLDATQSFTIGTSTRTLKQIFEAAWGQGAGTWTKVGTLLTIYDPLGVLMFSFTLDSSSAPTSRTRV